jgi:hypothetical protein
LVGAVLLAGVAVALVARWGSPSSATTPASSSSSSSSSTPSSSSPDGAGAAASTVRRGVDLAARQRLHLEQAAQAADVRVAIQELSTAIRIDPRTTAARDALLARARRFVDLGQHDRAREDLLRLQARDDLGPLRADVDALAATLPAPGP